MFVFKRHSIIIQFKFSSQNDSIMLTPRINKIFSLRTELKDLTNKITEEEKQLEMLKERKTTVEKLLKYHNDFNLAVKNASKL